MRMETSCSTTMMDISAFDDDQDDDRIECPCQKYASMSKLIEALESSSEQEEEESHIMQGLLDWLNGTTDAIALANDQRLSCGKRSRCRFRFGTSFAILNAIRDACRPYLEPGSLGSLLICNTANANNSNNANNSYHFSGNESSPASSKASEQPPPAADAVSYDEAFPTLLGGNDKHKAEANASANGFQPSTTTTSAIPHPAAANILVPRKKPTAAPRHPAKAATTVNVPGGAVVVVPKDKETLGCLSFAPHLETASRLVPPRMNNKKHPNDPTPAANIHILIPDKKTSNPKKHTTEIRNAPAVKKPKRRIRPQLANPNHNHPAASISNSVWGEQQQQQQSVSSSSSSSTTLMFGSGTHRGGNIASLPSEEPLTLGRKVPLILPEPILLDDTTIAVPTTPTKTKQVEETATTKSATTDIVVVDAIESKSSKAEHIMMTRMVDIYIALITNHLIPSTALELHLLIRLLTVSLLQETQTTTTLPLSQTTTTTTEPDENTPAFFASIFSSPQRCRSFAVLGLSRLGVILRNLGLPLVQALVHCEPFCTQLPEIAKELESVLKDYITRGLRTEYPTDAVTGTHAILSLPFEHDRDSRHNYRTQQEVQIYKNREESRDAFLYQLRAFMNVRGKVLRPQEADRALQRIQLESRNVMNGLLPVNMVWFAQFFCELLLQIGLAPMEETDQELLNIAGKEKLQKLHKRFSSKSTQANKSSKKVVLAQRKDTTTTSPVDEARNLFPGHQEFFFIFLQCADNYSFGIHVRSRMATVLTELGADHTTDDLERRLMNSQLFARFLGYLVFSPNWHGAGIDLRNIKPPASVDGLKQLDSLGLPLVKALEDAWRGGYVLGVVPWITELLKMAKWDSFTQSSRTYRYLLAQLRQIQEEAGNSSASPNHFGPTMQIVSFYLESFFHETAGFSKLTSLPQKSLCSVSEIEGDGSSMDSAVLGFSTVTLFASSSHVEDLSTLIAHLTSSVARLPTKSRKLRPSIVSRGIGLEMTSLFSEPPIDGKPLSTVTEWTTPVKSRLPRTPESATASIQAKLVDAFFHQHRDLKEICEFAVNRILKNASNRVASECIRPVFDESNLAFDSPADVFEEALANALKAARTFLHTCLESSIRQSLELLGPSGLHAKVLDVAASLAVTRGVQTGQPIIDALVATESNTVRESLARLQKKRLSGKAPATGEAQDSRAADDPLFKAVIDSMTDLRDSFVAKLWESDAERVVDRLRTLESSLGRWSTAHDTKIPPESTLRPFFELVIRLDNSSRNFLQWCMTLNAAEYRSIMSPYLRIVCRLAGHSKYGFRHLGDLIETGDLVKRLIESEFLYDDTASIEALASLLLRMVETRYIRLHQFRFLLTQATREVNASESRVREFLLLLEHEPIRLTSISPALDSLGRPSL